jgi:glycerophosphoryl diester phosphodiesterase
VTRRAAHLPPLKRVGHKGADRVSPGNTLASFDAAVGHGIDMIEFDVLRLRDGRLVLAHDHKDAASRETVAFDDGLEHFAGEAFEGIELDVDLKLPGYEREVVEGLAERGLTERSLISSMYPQSLDLVGELEPALRRGWSVPRVRSDPTRTAWRRPFALAALAVLRRLLPGRAAGMLRAGRCEAVMTHWRLFSPQLVEAVHSAGGQLYVWTVDDREHIERLSSLGVDGVITNDPRLFG